MSLQTSSFVNTNANHFPVIVITGVCRSGKTLLGNILATYNEVEYSDEPYALMMLPMVAKSGKINQDFAASWMSAMLRELFNDLLLLRTANFRLGDLSSIWTKKPAEEIFSRLTQISNRDQALLYAQQHHSKLMITLSECTPFLDFIIEAIPHVEVIHVVRHPFDVATATLQKKWYADDQIKKPSMAQLYNLYHYAGSDWYLPWWVNDEDYNYFIELSEFERGLYYWWSLISKSLNTHKSITLVRYEDLLENPTKILEMLSRKFQLTEGYFTQQKIREVKISESSVRFKVNSLLKDRLQNIMKELYECEFS